MIKTPIDPQHHIDTERTHNWQRAINDPDHYPELAGSTIYHAPSAKLIPYTVENDILSYLKTTKHSLTDLTSIELCPFWPPDVVETTLRFSDGTTGVFHTRA